jgi:hypothetical protein
VISISESVMCGRTYTRRHRARDVRRAQERAAQRAQAMQGNVQGPAEISG